MKYKCDYCGKTGDRRNRKSQEGKKVACKDCREKKRQETIEQRYGKNGPLKGKRLLPFPPKDELEKMYRIRDGRAVDRIAEHYNVSSWLVNDWLQEYEITRFSHMPTEFNDIQKQFFIGCMLSDASLTRPTSNNANSCFEEKHGPEQHLYTNWLYEKAFIDFCPSPPTTTSNNQRRLRTSHLSFLTIEHKKWYLRNEVGEYVLKENGDCIKIVPDIVLTPLIIAIWAIGDGYNYWNGSHSRWKPRMFELCTDGFIIAECEKLSQQITSMGFDCRVVFVSNRPRIRISATSFIAFCKMIENTLAPFSPPECIKYKYICIDYYEPNSRNKQMTRVEIDGIIKTLTEWCKEYKISKTTVSARHYMGWPWEKAIKTPKRQLSRFIT